jgi:hypothetical protein
MAPSGATILHTVLWYSVHLGQQHKPATLIG